MRKVLVVDDDLTTLTIIERVLQNANYEVLATRQPEQVVDLATNWSVDAIVLDVMMPGLSGYDVLKALRANRKTESVPILFLSALRDGAARVKGLREGADDYLAKPFEPEELVLRLERLVAPRPTYLAGLEGNLQNYAFHEVIQNLQSGGKSGVLAVVSRSGSGWLALRGGALVDATLGALRGADAVLSMLSLDEGHFRFEQVDPATRGFVSGEEIPLGQLLLYGAWVSDELSRRKAVLPPPQTPLEVAGLLPADLPEGYDQLPLDAVATRVSARGIASLAELQAEQIAPPQSVELAVSWLLEKGVLTPAVRSLQAVRSIAQEQQQSAEKNASARRFLKVAAARGHAGGSVHVLFLVGSDAWKCLPIELDGATLPFFEAQRESRRGGTCWIAAGEGELLVHLQKFTAESRPRIEALLTLSAAVVVLAGKNGALDAIVPVVDDVEGATREQTGLLVLSDPAAADGARALVAGKRRWRLSPEPLPSLGAILDRLC